MRLELTGRHVDITPVLRRLVDRKLGRLERLLNDSAVSAQVVLTLEKRGRRADITLHARGEKFLHGVGESANWETSVSRAIDKIVQQAQKVKGKWQARKRVASRRAPLAPQAAEAVPPPIARAGRVREPAPRIRRAARQAVKPMSIADAAREIDANGEGVVVFRDPDTAAIHVLYRRTNGELTLVETEA
jgi:putative sigma-54 modulation protein